MEVCLLFSQRAKHSNDLFSVGADQVLLSPLFSFIYCLHSPDRVEDGSHLGWRISTTFTHQSSARSNEIKELIDFSSSDL